LLVKSEGGDVEEIIDEESGILISTMLRQYFMGLRSVGQWKNISEHWVRLAQNSDTPVSPVATTKPASDELFKAYTGRRNMATEAKSEQSGDEWTSFLHSRIGLSKAPINDDSDSEEEGPAEEDEDAMDFEILLMKKFWARWVRKAGVRASVCDPLKEGEYAVDWTRTIAPVLDGRIKMIGA
jgi:hypothetical protein